MVPNLDHPLCGAGEEDGGHVSVPRDVVDGRVVGVVGLQVLGAVLRRALIDQALVSAHQEHGVVAWVEGHTPTALWKVII